MENVLGIVVHSSYPSEGWKHKIGGEWSRLAWEKCQTLISKIIMAKRARSVPQVVASKKL
jgi:hypothetical protein